MIAWKDIFKPRYALVITIEEIPTFTESILVPVIKYLPYKRPLSMEFNVFYSKISRKYGEQSFVFCGSYRTLRNLYGIGSTSKQNMKNAILLNNK